MNKRLQRRIWQIFTLTILIGSVLRPAAGAEIERLLERLGIRRGICVVLGADDPQFPVELARASELLIYVQSADPHAVAATRAAADAAEFLGTRIYVERGSLDHLHLASNLADGVIVRQTNQTRQASLAVDVPGHVRQLWEFLGSENVEPTAPVVMDQLAVWSGLDGIVRACELANGKLRWKFYTGGAVRFPPEIADGRVYVGSGDGWVYCLEAATGNLLWRFRAAPAQRKIAVHGQLLSTWPVGSGVLVADGVVYAAAGIASYDGTHVYALDAVSGDVIWQNNTSGQMIGEDQVTGVSVPGHLLLHEDRLYLAGGNIVSPAVYDAQSGECLNTIELRSPRGRELFLVDGTVRVFDQLLYSPPQYQRSEFYGGNFLQANNGQVLIRATVGKVVRLGAESAGSDQTTGVWTYAGVSHLRALALGNNTLLVAGKQLSDKSEDNYLVNALRVEDGQMVWSAPLPAEPIAWGLALGRNGHIVVTMTNGQVACFGPLMTGLERKLSSASSAVLCQPPPPRFCAFVFSQCLDRKCLKAVKRNARNRPRSGVADPT